jgi:hypothetical protein
LINREFNLREQEIGNEFHVFQEMRHRLIGRSMVSAVDLAYYRNRLQIYLSIEQDRALDYFLHSQGLTRRYLAYLVRKYSSINDTTVHGSINSSAVQNDILALQEEWMNYFYGNAPPISTSTTASTAASRGAIGNSPTNQANLKNNLYLKAIQRLALDSNQYFHPDSAGNSDKTNHPNFAEQMRLRKEEALRGLMYQGTAKETLSVFQANIKRLSDLSNPKP